jgi:hypothetical protein
MPAAPLGPGGKGGKGGRAPAAGAVSEMWLVESFEVFGGEMNWGRRDLRGIRPPPGMGNGGGGTPGEESVR